MVSERGAQYVDLDFTTSRRRDLVSWSQNAQVLCMADISAQSSPAKCCRDLRLADADTHAAASIVDSECRAT